MVLRFASWLILALLVASLCGCATVCDRACSAQMDAAEGCLDHWGVTWTGLGFADKEAAIDDCQTRYADALGDRVSDTEERKDKEIRDSCTRLLEELEVAGTCEEVLQSSGF